MSDVYNENGLWYFKSKTIDKNYVIKYIKKGGYESEEEANAQLAIQNKRYLESLKKSAVRSSHPDTFIEYCKYWHDSIFVQMVQSNLYAYKTESLLYNVILPNIDNNIYMNEVTSSVLQELIYKIANGSIYIEKIIQVILNNIFNVALEEGAITSNPMNDIERVKIPSKPLTLLTSDQIRIFLDYIYHNHYDCYLEVLLALFGGMRLGEIRGLCAENIDFDNHIIMIRQQLGKYYGSASLPRESIQILKKSTCLKQPKNNSCRNIKLHPEIFHEIQIRLNRNRSFFLNRNIIEECDKEFLCIGRSGDFISSERLEKIVTETCRKNDLPIITFHGLRHICASLLLESMGIENLQMISRFLGHKDVMTTYNIYCGIIDGNESLKEELNHLAAAYCI